MARVSVEFVTNFDQSKETPVLIQQAIKIYWPRKTHPK